jgi:hypothetical protein
MFTPPGIGYASLSRRGIPADARCQHVTRKMSYSCERPPGSLREIDELFGD